MSAKILKTRVKSEETRALILNTALALFREHGFEKTTMREIASKAGVALGGAYYYFDSKDALVLAFYAQSQAEMEPRLEAALGKSKGLEDKIRSLLETKLEYFKPNRGLLGTLAAHTNPAHPLSPFGKETRAIRERDTAWFAAALERDKKKYPADIVKYLPGLLWMYQMGLILYWVFDQSNGQKRTWQLLDKSLPIVTKMIQISSLPLMRPVRKLAVELLETVYDTSD